MKYFVILFLMIILFGCSQKEERLESIAELNIFAVDTFLNDNFYKNSFPIFERIFKCKVNVRYFPNIETLLEYRKTNEADVFLGFDNTIAHEVIADSFLVKYESNNYKKVKEELVFEQNYITPVYYSPLAFIYKEDELENIPETFGAIQDGKLKDKIIMANADSSSIGRAALIWSVAAFGNSGFQHFWRSIKNNVYKIVENHDLAHNMLLAGEAPIIVGFQTTPLHQDILDYDSVIPSEGAYNFIVGAGISTNTSNLELSQKFIDYLLSDIFQDLVQTELVMFPVSKDVEQNRDFSALETVNKDLTNKISARDLNLYLDEWLRRWKRIML